MTLPEPMVAGQAGQSAIYDLGYRGYDGPRLGRRAAVWALFTASLRAAWGLGRSGRSKIVPWGALAFASLSAVVQSAVNATAGPLAARAGPGVNFHNYIFQSSVFVFIFLAAQAPELLGGDQRNRVLALYFAHAMERMDYAAAKLGAMVVSLLALCLVPLTILFLGLTFGSADLVAGFRDQLGNVPEIIGVAVIYALLYSAVGMAISAFTPRRAYAIGAIVAVFLVGTALPALVRRAASSIGDWPTLLDVNAVAEGVRHALFGGPANGPVANASIPNVGYYATFAAVIIVGYAVYFWRYQRVQA
jgi:ABC-2 type transport system permease protein